MSSCMWHTGDYPQERVHIIAFDEAPVSAEVSRTCCLRHGGLETSELIGRTSNYIANQRTYDEDLIMFLQFFGQPNYTLITSTQHD